MRQQRGVFRKPGPVHAIEDEIGQLSDSGMSEMLAAGEDSAEQDRGIDRRHLGIPNSFSRVDVREVIEETAMLRQFSPQKAKGGNRSFNRRIPGNETPLLSNAQRG